MSYAEIRKMGTYDDISKCEEKIYELSKLVDYVYERKPVGREMLVTEEKFCNLCKQVLQ